MLDRALMESAFEEIENLRLELLQAREGTAPDHPRYQSLLNLRQYMILRSRDRTELQEKLFLMSLTSLGRSFAHVAASVDTLYDQLSSSLYCKSIPAEEMERFHHVTIEEAIACASENSSALFGGKSSSKLSKQGTAVMVTLPSHAAENGGALIRSLAEARVNVFRINTAHDTPEVWQAMADVIADINRLRPPENALRIFVDLAGPKIRTGKIERLELPVRIGSNRMPKQVIIRPGDGETCPETTDPFSQLKNPAQISVDRRFFKKLKCRKPIRLHDAHGKKAHLMITELGPEAAKAVIDRKVYLDASSTLSRKHFRGRIRNIAAQVDPIRLFEGDTLLIAENIPGRSALRNDDGTRTEPARIGCCFSGIASFVAAGDPVFIDDGKIGLEATGVRDGVIRCRVTHAKPTGTLLKEEKGINFPESHIATPALTDADRGNLDAVIGFADHLGISFCQSAEDVAALQKLLQERGRGDIGIIAKIETRRAVTKMPEILEQLLTCEKSGVMIARGDLAIEVGFRNMAALQEKLLDICDAAHMPVIWATQVLESQMKSNLPSRAEVTDAAMAGRAECVMLNKGAFAVDTIDVLKHILREMHLLFKKHRQLLSREELWEAPDSDQLRPAK
jgi:pyruvate kinase